MHVLLVEDNALVASGVRAGLQLQGFGVDTVASAGQADAAIRSSHFDACVLDLGLPDEDGLSLLARWRGQGLQVPVLVLTARDAVSQRIEGLQTGADDYLVKPFDLHELAARLPLIEKLPCEVVIDHIGRLHPPFNADDPNVRSEGVVGRDQDAPRSSNSASAFWGQ